MRRWPDGGTDAAWRAGVWPDVALGAALALGGQAELAASGEAGWPGLMHGMLLLAQTVPVIGRRVAPAAMAGLGAAALATEALATTPTNTLSGLLAGLVLIYSVGRYVTGLRLAAVTAAIAAALAAHMLRLPNGQVSDLAFAAIFSAGAWLAGRTMQRRELERRRAEADTLAQQRTAAATLDAAVANERARIARELHDVVAHGMGAMVVQAAAAEQLLASDPAAAREPLSTVRQTGQGALVEMRRLLGLLRDGADTSEPEPQPGLDRLPQLVDRLRRGGMAVTLTVTGTRPELPDGLQLCIYRIVQEALTNALKHAGGARAEVTLDYSERVLVVRVRNEPGRPTVAAQADGLGHGLIGMRERVRLYGGTLHTDGQPDGCYLVEASVPVPS